MTSRPARPGISQHALYKDHDTKFWLEVLVREGKLKPGQLSPEDIATNKFNANAQLAQHRLRNSKLGTGQGTRADRNQDLRDNGRVRTTEGPTRPPMGETAGTRQVC
jgi:hypothetical protein